MHIVVILTGPPTCFLKIANRLFDRCHRNQLSESLQSSGDPFSFTFTYHHIHVFIILIITSLVFDHFFTVFFQAKDLSVPQILQPYLPHPSDWFHDFYTISVLFLAHRFLFLFSHFSCLFLISCYKLASISSLMHVIG